MSQSRVLLIWFLVYAVLVTLVLGGLWQARERVLAELGRPEARADWQEWKHQTEEPQPDEPVVRRPVKSDEHPAVVLMRDHFGAIVGSCLLIGTFVFAFLAFLVQGISRERSAQREQKNGRRAGDRSADG